MKFLLLMVFVVLTGCETLKQPLLTHHAVIGIYPTQMPPLPEGERIVLVGGVFDLIHYGHLRFLEAAKSQGDYLVVAIESDSFIKHRKRRDPVHLQRQRAELLAHLDMVDEVVMLPPMKGYKDYVNLVEVIHPQVIAVTEGDPHLAQKEKQAALVGAEIAHVMGRNRGFSTRDILRHMCKKEETPALRK